MGIYYFCVDYENELQMWSPKGFSDKCPWHPNHPLPHMMFLKNKQGFYFEVVSDVDSYAEHGFKNITEEVYEELKKEFTNYDWDKGVWKNRSHKDVT